MASFYKSKSLHLKEKFYLHIPYGLIHISYCCKFLNSFFSPSSKLNSKKLTSTMLDDKKESERCVFIKLRMWIKFLNLKISQDKEKVTWKLTMNCIYLSNSTVQRINIQYWKSFFKDVKHLLSASRVKIVLQKKPYHMVTTS